ncbi:beta-lactamase family protein [Streptomyces sp. NBC_00269]|uniref:serine hydrolase domain-containing protein n=1 Tax=Streptomyces sp. NBC_00269 TaxID=2975696 RepID=UPI002E282000|nr:serine hydrolase domain-containing protein [Streptomyces sp. NBC_00269]
MPVLRTLLAIPLAAALFCMFPGSSTSLAAPATDATLPLLVTEGKAPAAALLAREGGTTRFVRTGPTIRRTDHFRAGSITKSFIAAVVLQLAAEHRLRLSDTVDDHLPGLLRDHSVSLRSLLTHTSGLPDFTARTHGTIPVSPKTAVQLSEADPPSPRDHWSYSNTNYVVLGMVIGQVTGHSYATEARHRIIEPLHLTGTSFPGTRTTLPTPHGRAYDATGDDVTTLNPRVAGAAGELISTLTDLNRFYTALLKGRLLPPSQLRTMLNTRTAQGRYGMGLYPTKLPCGTTIWGHNGRIEGSYVRTAATRTASRVITFRTNTDTAKNTPELERHLLTAEFCQPFSRSDT